MQWPRPPSLDAERWFKRTLSALLQSQIEGEGGGEPLWREAVRTLVPYHPAGRLPERKITAPAAAALPSKALPGERELLTALAALPDTTSRWALLYDDHPDALAARLAAPESLGGLYDWTALGPGASWASLAAWARGDETFRSAMRRAVPDRFILAEGRADRLAGPSLLPHLLRELPDSVSIPWGAPDLAAPILAACTLPESRVILVAEEAAVAEILRMLVEHADVRDRVSAVLSIGGIIGGRHDEEGRYGEPSCRDWLEAHFTQGDLDTEIVRFTPYLSVQWLHRSAHPPGAPGLSLAASRFPEPLSDVPIDTIESIDLGALPADRPLPPDLAAKALIAVVCGFVRSRR